MGDGSLTHFVEMMNERAHELGATNTTFVNATGLYEASGGNTTTAEDVAILARHALTLDGFLDYCEARSMEIGPTNVHSSLVEINYNSISNTQSEYYYAAAQGIKTAGSQEGIGYGLVSTATQDGFAYLLVILDTPTADSSGADLTTYYHYTETAALYDWVFDAFTVMTLVEEGTPVADIPVRLSHPEGRVQRHRRRPVYRPGAYRDRCGRDHPGTGAEPGVSGRPGHQGGYGGICPDHDGRRGARPGGAGGQRGH